MVVNMVTTVYQFYTIIIFYYNVRSAVHKMQTSNRTENQYKWLQSWKWVDKHPHVQFNLRVSTFQSCCSSLPTYTLCDVVVVFAVPGPGCGVKEVVTPMIHSSYLCLCCILRWVWLLDSSIVMFGCHLWNGVHVARQARNGMKCGYQLQKTDSPLPRSVIFTIIHLLPSNTLELEVSSLKLWLKFDPTDMMDVDIVPSIPSTL